MRLIILIAGLMLTTHAMADEKPTSAAKELDKSSTKLLSTSSPNDQDDATESGDRGVVSPRDAASGMATGKRQHAAPPSDGGDYNSSRSNKTHAPATTCTDGMDNDCDGVADATPANHNTTRANRTLRSAPQSDGNSGGTRAQDYNSSRSNTTTAILDTDSDNDSLEEVRCSRVSDECVDAGNGDDPVVRKKPGKR